MPSKPALHAAAQGGSSRKRNRQQAAHSLQAMCLTGSRRAYLSAAWATKLLRSPKRLRLVGGHVPWDMFTELQHAYLRQAVVEASRRLPTPAAAAGVQPGLQLQPSIAGVTATPRTRAPPILAASAAQPTKPLPEPAITISDSEDESTITDGHQEHDGISNLPGSSIADSMPQPAASPPATSFPLVAVGFRRKSPCSSDDSQQVNQQVNAVKLPHHDSCAPSALHVAAAGTRLLSALRAQRPQPRPTAVVATTPIGPAHNLMELTARDLGRVLGGGCWLNDEAVNFYMLLIQKRNNEWASCSPAKSTAPPPDAAAIPEAKAVGPVRLAAVAPAPAAAAAPTPAPATASAVPPRAAAGKPCASASALSAPPPLLPCSAVAAAGFTSPHRSPKSRAAVSPGQARRHGTPAAEAVATVTVTAHVAPKSPHGVILVGPVVGCSRGTAAVAAAKKQEGAATAPAAAATAAAGTGTCGGAEETQAGARSCSGASTAASPPGKQERAQETAAAAATCTTTATSQRALDGGGSVRQCSKGLAVPSQQHDHPNCQLQVRCPLASAGSRPPPPNTYAFNSFFFSKLTAGGIRGRFEYEEVRRWTRPCRTRTAECVLLRDLLLFPINHHNTHWCLAAVWPRRRLLQYFDSLGGSAATSDWVLGALLDWLLTDARDKGVAQQLQLLPPAAAQQQQQLPAASQQQQQRRQLQAPQAPQAGPAVTGKREGTKPETAAGGWRKERVAGRQMDGSSCGVFACVYAELLSRGVPPEEFRFLQADVPALRRGMAEQMLLGALGGQPS